MDLKIRSVHSARIIEENANNPRNPDPLTLEEYQFILVSRGNCSEAWFKRFPLWLNTWNLGKLILPAYVWDSLWAVWFEDDRLKSGRKKSRNDRILDAVAKVLEETT